jgi:hypothetical protein
MTGPAASAAELGPIALNSRPQWSWGQIGPNPVASSPRGLTRGAAGPAPPGGGVVHSLPGGDLCDEGRHMPSSHGGGHGPRHHRPLSPMVGRDGSGHMHVTALITERRWPRLPWPPSLTPHHATVWSQRYPGHTRPGCGDAMPSRYRPRWLHTTPRCGVNGTQDIPVLGAVTRRSRSQLCWGRNHRPVCTGHGEQPRRRGNPARGSTL